MSRYLGVALLCFVSSLLGSAITLVAARAMDKDREPPASRIVARELVLEDSAGRERLRLQGEPGSEEAAQLVVYDENHTPRIRIAAAQDGGAYVSLMNSELPNPDHKRILLGVDATTARMEMGHGELTEIELRSGPPTAPPRNLIQVLARNGSQAAMYTDQYGHATIEVKDPATASLFRVPETKPLLPEDQGP